uniref:Uncharacterized protein n=1 Tax=Knipowitschia caucasica TaxID=637954 RepID=A0AAV2JPQ5_KNICA
MLIISMSRQEKKLGHQLSSPKLSITVSVDQWCRTHPGSPAGPLPPTPILPDGTRFRPATHIAVKGKEMGGGGGGKLTGPNERHSIPVCWRGYGFRPAICALAVGGRPAKS